MRSPVRRFTDWLEYLAALAFFGALSLLPARTASDFGGWLGRAIGPHIGRTRLARRQMAEHLPELSQAARDAAIREMWENLGRTLTEYPHLKNARLAEHITVSGAEHIDAAIESGKPVLMFSGHIGNWEICSFICTRRGMKLHLLYRPPNNPLIDKLIDRVRLSFNAGHYGKGKEGARGAMRAILKGDSVGVLIDQKDNEGALIPFLGAPAMTSVVMARLALKYQLPVIPARAVRHQGIVQEVIFYPPLSLPEGRDEAAAEALMQQMNEIISSWVRERPGQWFWLHRRWPKGDGHAAAA
jgi:Kdo2-lipid IVA lauroyltransferase/acyltransferase